MVSKRFVLLGIFALSIGAAFAGTLLNLQGETLQGELVSGGSVVVDDGDAGFTTIGTGWQSFSHALGYKGDFSSPTSLSDPALSATWTFPNATTGKKCSFFVTFKAYSLLTNQAPYTIMDGTKTIGSKTVNQKADPLGNTYDGRNWTLLGTYTVNGSSVSITLTRPQGLTANGMIADAARIECTGSATSSIGTTFKCPPSMDPTECGRLSCDVAGGAYQDWSGKCIFPDPGPVVCTQGYHLDPGDQSKCLPDSGYCPYGATICHSCPPSMTTLDCGEMNCALNNKVYDYETHQCACLCPDNSLDPSCSCLPAGPTCPQGYHLDSKRTTCLPDSVCGDGYIDTAGSPQEFCEPQNNQGCPAGRTCSGCKTCLFCGDAVLSDTEECEADYTCASGKSCSPDCQCIDSATPLTASVTTTVKNDSHLVTKSPVSSDITRTSWSLPVHSGEIYDIYVSTQNVCTPTSCPSPACPLSFWRVYNGSQQVRPLIVEYGNPLCSTWPETGKDTAWIRLVQIQANSASIKVEHEPSPLPTTGDPAAPARALALADAVRLVKVATSTPAPLGVTLIDDGDQGFNVSGEPWLSRSSAPSLPWTSLEGTLPLFDDDFSVPFPGQSSIFASWSFTVAPGNYQIFATYKVNPSSDFANINAVYSIRNGSLFDSNKEVGKITVNQSKTPKGPLYRNATWESLGAYSITGNRLTVVLLNPYGLSADAVRIERKSDSVSSSSSSSAPSSVASSSSAPSSVASSSSSTVTCAAEGTVVSEANMRPCCSGLFLRPNLSPANNQCPDLSLNGVCTRCGNGQCGVGENFCNCLADCPRPSSSSSMSSQAWTECATGYMCTKKWTNNQCASLSIDCFSGTLQCDSACGNSACSGQCCKCVTGSSSSSSSSIAAVTCTDSDGNDYFTAGKVWVAGTVNEDSCEQCSIDSAGYAECALLKEWTCVGPQMASEVKNCDDVQAGFICKAGRCMAPSLPTGSFVWQTVGSSYIISTLTDYTLFGYDSYLYLAGGMDFWGATTKSVLRSSDGLKWISLVSLPQPLANAASLQLEGNALLLGGLTNTDSVVQWAFSTPDLSSISFKSNSTYALPVPRYDAAALRVGNSTYLLGGYYKATPLGGSLLGSLLGALIGESVVPYPSKEIYVHNGTNWSRIQPDLPFHVTKNDAFTLGGKLFILDGSSPRKVFVSENGAVWKQVSTLPDATSNTILLKPTLHKGSVWLIGKTGSFAGSAIVTTDGLQWTSVTGAFPSDLDDFTPNTAISFKDELWVLGTVSDYYGSGYNGKVLKSGVLALSLCGNNKWDNGEECDSTAESLVNPCGQGGICDKDCRCLHSCAQDGQKVYGSALFGPVVCCSKNAGIKPKAVLTGGECAITNDVSIGTCVDNWWQTCGNGTCATGEDKCNCPEDCSSATCGNGKCETGEKSITCPIDCAVDGPTCGDGIIEGENCDDKNTANGDGCNQYCAVEPGWTCNGSTGQTSVCHFGSSSSSRSSFMSNPANNSSSSRSSSSHSSSSTWKACSPGYQCSKFPLSLTSGACYGTGVGPGPNCHDETNGETCGDIPMCIGICFKFVCDESSSSSSSSLACAQNGQKVYGSAQFGPTVCCSQNAGIKSNSVLAGDLCMATNDGSKGTCVDNWWQTCGNGTCATGEDKCNCPQDCAVACPVFTPPLCMNGILVPQLGPDANGCKLPPVCCNGATNPNAKCTMDLKCSNGSCIISACTCM